MSLWDKVCDVVVDTGSRLGNVAGTAALRAKLNTDLLLIDRELTARKQKFGVEMYDYVHPLSKNQAFYTSDDTLTLTLQPPLITAQREIAALEIKRNKQQILIEEASKIRACAFRPADNWMDKVGNLGKSAALGGNEAKLATELAIYNGQILHFKQEFGLNLYKTLEELEDTKQWLPTDREIRSIYDNCRRDVEKIEKRRLQKLEEIKTLMNGGVPEYDPTMPSIQTTEPMSIKTIGPQPSAYAKQVTDISTSQTTGQPTAGIYSVQAPQQQQPTSTYYQNQQQQPTYSQQQQPYMQQQSGYSQHQQPYVQQHPHQPQMNQHQGQPQPVLHSNLFAGVVPGTAPLPTTATTTTAKSDPFAASQDDDLFAAFAAPAPSVPQQTQPAFAISHDPFANNFTPPPLVAQATPAATQSGYVDPFSGL